MEGVFESSLLEKAVSELSKLPGIGRKTALRLSLHLLRRDVKDTVDLGTALIEMRQNVNYCRKCHNISENSICPICEDNKRDHLTLCVVENIKDVITLESTRQYHGLYHVLGGLISPLDGIAPSDLEIQSLIDRIGTENIQEVILALSPTIEGDTTNYYIYKKLEDSPVKVTVLARGVSIGSDLEYTDELTLGKSIQNRILYSDTFSKK